MNEPVRVLSDLHLGHKISRISDVAALRPLIKGAGTVIFNGDTWQELAKPFFERSKVMLDELVTLCRSEGADTLFLSGNHDPGWSGPGWVDLAGGRIVITHGDALLFDGSPWKREILVGGKRVMELWNKHPAADQDAEERIRVAREIARELCAVEHPTGRNILLRAWDAARPPVRAVKMIEAWFNQDKEGDKFCERYFPIINTGSFMAPGRAHWVEWNNGWLSRGVIDENLGSCQKGKTLDVWRL
jgi:hypothetical protein